MKYCTIEWLRVFGLENMEGQRLADQLLVVNRNVMYYLTRQTMFCHINYFSKNSLRLRPLAMSINFLKIVLKKFCFIYCDTRIIYIRKQYCNGRPLCVGVSPGRGCVRDEKDSCGAFVESRWAREPCVQCTVYCSQPPDLFDHDTG